MASGLSFRLVPRPAAGEDAAVAQAVVRAGLRVERVPDAYGSSWRAAALAEGVDRMPAAAKRTQPAIIARPGSARATSSRAPAG